MKMTRVIACLLFVILAHQQHTMVYKVILAVVFALNIQLGVAQVVDAGQLDFRASAPPALGMITIALATAAIVYFGRSSGIEFLSDFTNERRLAIHKVALYATYGYLTLAAVFMFYSIAWVEAYMLAFLSLFSFYHVWIQDRRGILIGIIAGAFLEFIISGKLALFGFNRNLADFSAVECYSYYYGTYIGQSGRCDPKGYLNFLRLLGLAAIIIEPIAIYFAYSLYEMLSNRSDAVRAGYSSFRDETSHNAQSEVRSSSPNQPVQTSSTYQSYQVVEEP